MINAHLSPPVLLSLCVCVIVCVCVCVSDCVCECVNVFVLIVCAGIKLLWISALEYYDRNKGHL